MNYKNIGKNKLNEGIDLLVKLINIDSVLTKFDPSGDAPFGEGNKKALNLLLDTAEKDGFTTKNISNFAGHIEYGPKDGEIVGVLAHLDVVPVNRANWSSDPFSAVVTDKSIIGRGSTDDKGPLVASYMAIKAIKESGLPVTKRVRLIAGCDEETGSRGLSKYFTEEEMPKVAFSPDADWPLIYGEKAITSFDINGSFKDSIVESFESGIVYNMVPDTACMTLSENLVKEYLTFLKVHNYKGEIIGKKYYAYGLSAHGSMPQIGNNAVFILAEFLEEFSSCEFSRYVVSYLKDSPYGEKLGIDVDGKDMGNLTCNLGFVKTNKGDFTLGINLRIPVDNYKDVIVEKLEKSFSSFKSLSHTKIDVAPIHYVDPSSNLVKTLLDAYTSITGDFEAKPKTIGGGTYAKFIPNCVAYGPETDGKDNFIHNANEFIDLADFETAIAIYTKAIYELIK